MLVEKSKEKTFEQIFEVKFTPKENNKRQSSAIRRETLPWMQKDVTRNTSNDTMNFNEESIQQTKNRNTTQSTVFQVRSMEKTSKPSKREEMITSIIEDPLVNNRQQNMSDEILQYRQVIQSLRSELAEYKIKMNAMQPEIIRYDQNTKSLRSELAEYKTKINPMQLEIIRYDQNTKSLRSELAEYKTKLELTTKNQQNDIDSLRSELAEYKTKINPMQLEIVQCDQVIQSLRGEISRLTNYLDLMILK
ncbi:MAG TPA: hypothetical protein VEU72_09035 [Nitrosopumilaceae archaeon]|nr:hypothetical protein [Nitrosopumilaceae archaeon]